MARFRATAPAARSVLDGREHDGMLGRVGASPPHTNQASKNGNGGSSKSKIMLTDTELGVLMGPEVGHRTTEVTREFKEEAVGLIKVRGVSYAQMRSWVKLPAA